MANSKADTHLKNNSEKNFAEGVRLNQQEVIFDARFRRSYRTLHFIACRVLGGPERAEEAIGSCWRIASRHPHRFEDEGEFRRWLLRVLIDEALVLLRESVPTPPTKVFPAQAFRSNDVSDHRNLGATQAQHMSRTENDRTSPEDALRHKR